MFLKDKHSGNLVEVLDLNALFDPLKPALMGRLHAGEEMQDPTSFEKTELIFLSDETLPRCWLDVHYRSAQPPERRRRPTSSAKPRKAARSGSRRKRPRPASRGRSRA